MKKIFTFLILLLFLVTLSLLFPQEENNQFEIYSNRDYGYFFNYPHEAEIREEFGGFLGKEALETVVIESQFEVTHNIFSNIDNLELEDWLESLPYLEENHIKMEREEDILWVEYKNEKDTKLAFIARENYILSFSCLLEENNCKKEIKKIIDSLTFRNY